MPVLKPISGHTSCEGPYRYLTKNGRALASDYLNLTVPDKTLPGNVFPWWKVMNQTRRDFRHDRPWGGKPARTYKHYIISPDPDDGIELDGLRELSLAWAEKHFGDHECAIIYHDDNESGIPHAHVIVNSTNLETRNRLRDENPSALNRSLQRLADDRNLSRFENMEGTVQLSAQECREQRAMHPKSMQQEYMRRAEVQLKSQGQYSWVADIRARVKVARSVAHSESEFRNLLGELGVQVADNSIKAARADWVYSLADAPTRRVSGEKLGLAYGRESLLRRFEDEGGHALPAAYGHRMAEIAKNAVEVKDLSQLQRLSDAVALIERGQIKSALALEAYMDRPYEKKAWNDLTQHEAEAAGKFIQQQKMLPFRTHGRPARTPIKSEDAYAATRPQRRDDAHLGAARALQRESARVDSSGRQQRNDQER